MQPQQGRSSVGLTRLRSLTLLSLLALFASVFSSIFSFEEPVAQAAINPRITYSVTTVNDSGAGTGSLRDAITQADAGSGGTITSIRPLLQVEP